MEKPRLTYAELDAIRTNTIRACEALAVVLLLVVLVVLI